MRVSLPALIRPTEAAENELNLVGCYGVAFVAFVIDTDEMLGKFEEMLGKFRIKTRRDEMLGK